MTNGQGGGGGGSFIVIDLCYPPPPTADMFVSREKVGLHKRRIQLFSAALLWIRRKVFSLGPDPDSDPGFGVSFGNGSEFFFFTGMILHSK